LTIPVSAFAVNNRDLILSFAETGKPNLEVNIGSVSNYINLGITSPGSTIAVSGYSAYHSVPHSAAPWA